MVAINSYLSAILALWSMCKPVTFQLFLFYFEFCALALVLSHCRLCVCVYIYIYMTDMLLYYIRYGKKSVS
jgi:hypothetical protein